MAFHFRLEQVLRFRKQLEELAMQSYAAAVAQRDAVTERIEAVHIAKAELRTELIRFAEMSDGERWVAQSSYAALKAELEVLHIQRDEMEIEVDRCRQILIKKAQERELLDTLKEKQAIRYAYEERLKEQRTNDETATLRYKPASY